LAEGEAFTCIQDAVREGTAGDVELRPARLAIRACRVSGATANRFWAVAGQNTPPFCFDWGARCSIWCTRDRWGISDCNRDPAHWKTVTDGRANGHDAIANSKRGGVAGTSGPGSVFLHSTARAYCMVSGEGSVPARILNELGGGLEIRCQVAVFAIGSGLGNEQHSGLTVIRA